MTVALASPSPAILLESSKKDAPSVDEGGIKGDFAKSETVRKKLIDDIGNKIFTLFSNDGNQISVNLGNIYDPYLQSPFAELAAPYVDISKKVYLVALLKLEPAEKSKDAKAKFAGAPGAKVQDFKKSQLKDDGLPSDLRLLDACYFSRDIERFKPGAEDPVSRRKISSIAIYSIDFRENQFKYRGKLLDCDNPPSMDERERIFCFMNANELDETNKKIEELAHQQYITGVAYHSDELGCHYNFKDVLYWYNQAAKNGNLYANIALSTLFQTGSFEDGEPKVMKPNTKIAKDYLLKAVSCIEPALKAVDSEMAMYLEGRRLIQQLYIKGVPNKDELAHDIADNLPNPFGYVVAHRMAGNILYSRAVSLMEENNVTEAPKYLRRAIDIYSKALETISRLSEECDKQKAGEDLIRIKLFSNAIVLNQTKADCLFNLAACIRADPKENSKPDGHKAATKYLQEALTLYETQLPDLAIIPKLKMCLDGLSFHIPQLPEEDKTHLARFVRNEHNKLAKIPHSAD
jgi:hypothetical protein